MATTKTVYIEDALGTSKQFAPEVASSDIATDAIYRNIIDLNWGDVPRNMFLLDRPLGDGQMVRGSVWGPRTMTWQIASTVNRLSAAAISEGSEPVRDDEETVLNAFLLNPLGSPHWLKQTRICTDEDAVQRKIKAYLNNHRSWRWNPSDIGEGFVGSHTGVMLVKSLDWYCPFPWFVSYGSDDDIVTSSGNTLDNTNRSVTFTNPGDVPCGIKVTISGASGTAAVTICAGYSTASYTTPNNSIVISSVSPGGVDFVVDWFGSDPTIAEAHQGATDQTTLIAAGSKILLPKGSNTIHYAASSVVTGWTIRFDVYPLWGSP